MHLNNPNRNPISDPYALEDQLARELQRRKVEEEKHQREIQRICAQSEEIKLLKQKVQTAYVTKERTQQLAEQQLRRMQELKSEAELEAQLLEKRRRELEEEKQKERIKLEQRLNGKYTLQKQMLEHEKLKEEAKEQYQYEKDQVNRVIQRLINEDREQLEFQAKKKKIAFSDMQNALYEKAELIRRNQEREKQENQKYLDYIKEKDRQAHEIKVKKQEENAAKDKIFQRLKEEDERRKQEEELLTELRYQLYQEQYDAQQRQKDIDEAHKREFQKREMQQAEREARERKQRQKEEEQRMEYEFREQMMRKFAEDDKLEQLGQQKRRMKEQEHKREVERLWQEKLKMYQMEKERELEQLEKQRREELYKKQIIEEEKNRILQENLQQVGEFIPKGLLLKPGDTNYIRRTQPNASYQSGFNI